MKIKLGEKMSNGGSIAPSEPSKDKVYYPSVSLSGTDKKLSELPDSGTITFRFTKQEESKEKREGKTTWRCRLDLQEITGVKGGESEGNEFEDVETAMSRYKEEAESEEEEDED